MTFPAPMSVEDVLNESDELSADVHRNGKHLGAIFTADQLQRERFDPQRFAVPGLIPEGLTILCGNPKIGKSRLGLNFALAVASGGVALSFTEVAKGGVLYLSLEDGPRRLQERIAALLGEGGEFPALLTIATEWPRLDQGGLEQLDAHITEHKPRLVMVDVLQAVRAPSKSRASVYGDDYIAIRALKQVADKHKLAMVLIHHTRKQDAVDPLDMVSGSNGLGGAADAVLIMKREPLGGGVTLYLRGRDVEECQYTLAYDRESGAWAIEDAAREKPLARTREDVVRVLEAAWPEPVAAKDIAAKLGIASNTCDQRLHQMVQAELIRRVGRGLYTTVDPPLSLRSGTKKAKEGDDRSLDICTKDAKEGESKGPILTLLSTPLERDSSSGGDGLTPEPEFLSFLSTVEQKPADLPADCVAPRTCRLLTLCPRALAGEPCVVPTPR